MDARDTSSSQFAIHKWSGTSKMMFQWCLLGGLSVGYYTSFPWMNWDMETQNKKGPFFNYHMKPLNYLGELWLTGSPIPSLSLRPPGYTGWGDKAFKDHWGRPGESTPSGQVGKIVGHFALSWFMGVFGSLAAQTCFAPGILSSMVTLSTIKSDDRRGEGREEKAKA